jgi:two-component system chemotaxis sensor kinase CheA
MDAAEVEAELLLRTFLGETDDQLAEMEQALVTLEANPGNDEALDVIFRAAHTLKGNAASLGFTAVAELAHGIEDLLDRLRAHALAPTDAVVTLLLRAVDAVRLAMGGGREGAAPPPQHARILEEMTAAAGAASATSVVAAPLFEEPGQVVAPQGKDARTLRVDLDRLNRMLNLSGEIAVARGRFLKLLEDEGTERSRALLEVHRETDRSFMDLQEEILRARMVPLGPTFRQQIRTVRDAARAAGKMARLEIEGGDVEVDATLVEGMRGPITHMIRNALDHGIERPEVRAGRGKDPRGRVTLRARHDSGTVVIEVGDDGSGLDREGIADRATELGLISGGRTLGDSDLLQLVFTPGFSTSDSVTELSGRGIGMDVVRRNVEALRGTVDVRTEGGMGTTFTIRVPLTVAIIQGFLVGVGDETHVIPLEAVIECVDLTRGDDEPGGATGVVNLRGTAVPYLRLRDALGLPTPAAHGRESLVVITHKERRAALAVDALLGESQVVVKPFCNLLQRVPGVAGSTILGSGRVALILDVPALITRAGKSDVPNQERVQEDSNGSSKSPLMKERRS